MIENELLKQKLLKILELANKTEEVLLKYNKEVLNLPILEKIEETPDGITSRYIKLQEILKQINEIARI